jgi:autophagy-related protein 33
MRSKQGLSYSLSTITFPALLHLPTAPLAAQTNNYVRTASRATQRWLSTICTSAFIAAFLFSPRRLRHPYLLYTAAACQLGASTRVVDTLSAKLFPASWTSAATTSSSPAGRKAEELLCESGVMVGQGSSSEDEQDVNGEVVTREVEKGQARETVRAGLYGLGFMLGVVGIWGDLL